VVLLFSRHPPDLFCFSPTFGCQITWWQIAYLLGWCFVFCGFCTSCFVLWLRCVCLCVCVKLSLKNIYFLMINIYILINSNNKTFLLFF
jgi:hypothetical protein